MDEQTIRAIQDNPKYQELKARRGRLGWTLAILMIAVYFSYTGLIAFDKTLLARPIGDGVTSLGIPVGFGVIVFAVILTGIYVLRANTEFDRLTRELLAELKA